MQFIQTYNLDRRVSAHRERELYAWTLLVSVLLLLLLAWPFFSGDVYLADALGSFHLPSRAFYAQQIAKGEAFDWMPGLYSGFYLTGQGDAGTYHPVHWLLYRFLPFQAALGWEYLGSYPIMLTGMFVFLRRRLHRNDAAMLGSLVFTFSGFNILHFVHPNAVAAAAHIPWLLAMIDIILVEAQRWKVSLAQAALALLTGSQILLGCPQFVWFSLLLEASYTGFMVISRRYSPRDGCESMPSCRACIGCWRSSASKVVIGKCIGFLVGWMQVLPMLDSLFAASGSTAIAMHTGDSLNPLNLLQLVAPYLPINRGFGESSHEVSLYAGAVPLMLVLCVIIRRSELGNLRRLAIAAAGLGAAGLLLAIVNVAQLVHLGTHVPALAWLESSSRYTVLFQFSVAILASIGFMLVERQARQQNQFARHLTHVLRESSANVLWRQFELLGAAVLISAAVAVAGLILQTANMAASAPKVLVGPLLMTAAALLVVASAKGVRGAMITLVLFTAADLGYYGLSTVLTEQTAPLAEIVAEAAKPPVPPAAKVSTNPYSVATTDRVFAPPASSLPADNSIGNGLTLAGWSRTDGYSERSPQRQLNYFTLAALRLSGTRWVYHNEATANIIGLIPRDANWLEVPHPMPKARLVTHLVASRNPGADIEQIDIDTTALSELSLALPPGKPGEAMLQSQSAGCMLIKTTCPTQQMLVINESYHAGWRATIDGVPQRVYRINGDFLGCMVEPGTSEIRLDFQPDSLRRGFYTSLAGLGLIVCCVASGASRRELGFVEKIGIARKTG